jgi:TfoX/Sxy family transcriptional regulator of competence genes
MLVILIKHFAQKLQDFSSNTIEGRTILASDQSFVEFIVEQIATARSIRYRKMFGEYAIYCDDKVVALVCDNQLFIKPTEAGRNFIGTATEAPPYPGAKLHFRIDDNMEDRDWLGKLVELTFNELPVPKKKIRRER